MLAGFSKLHQIYIIQLNIIFPFTGLHMVCSVLARLVFQSPTNSRIESFELYQSYDAHLLARLFKPKTFEFQDQDS